MPDKVTIFDTTLRDGEQSAGVAFTPEEKLEIAFQLQKLGVDIIEAGFPVSTPGDLEAVKAIAREVRDVQAQPRKIISSPTWSGIESEEVCYNAG